MPRDAPAFDFYPERWLSGVALFSDAEQLAYLRLLCHQWLNEALPDNLAALKRLGGKGVTPQLLAKFPVGADGLRRNPRLEVIRTEQRERIARASDKARKMAAGRWGKDRSQPMHKQGTSSSQTLLVHGPGTPPAFHEPCPPPTTHPGERAGSAGAWAALEDVRAEAGRLLLPPEAAEKFWNDCEASGWVNRHGQPIADWRPLFRNFGTAWKANAARPAKPRHPAYDPHAATAGKTPGQILDF